MGGAIITAQDQVEIVAALHAKTALRETSLFVLLGGCIEKKAIAAIISAYTEQQQWLRTAAPTLFLQLLTTPETEITPQQQTGAMAEGLRDARMQCAIPKTCQIG
jgi:hypothetical protein